MPASQRTKNKLVGQILRCPDHKNELWYVSPLDKKRKLVTITNAHLFFKKLFILIKKQDLVKIPTTNDPKHNKNLTFRKKLKGKFIILDKNMLPSWYIDNNLNKVRITNFDFLDLLSSYAITISKEELELIPY